ncbi:MAG: YqjD family protein [Akkermansiaceae bacterium]
MEETFADPDFNTDSPFSETPASQKAASDLRAAAGDKARQIANDAGAKAQQLKQTAVDKAQQFREYAGNKASEIKDTAGTKAQQFKDAAGEQMQNSRVKAREAHADAEEYIRQHPTKSVLTALGVGVLIGLVIRR